MVGLIHVDLPDDTGMVLRMVVSIVSVWQRKNGYQLDGLINADLPDDTGMALRIVLRMVLN